MLVMILETVPVGLRGELSRWLLEPHPGVFVGHVSGMVRDKLWAKCCTRRSRKGTQGGGVIQIWSTNNEQHFKMRAHGVTKREIVDWEGVQLVRIPPHVEAEDGRPDHKGVQEVDESAHRDEGTDGF